MADDKPVHVQRPHYPSYPEVYPTTISYGGSGGIDDGEQPIHFFDLWNVILDRKWTVIGVVLTIVLTTAFVTYRQVPEFRATTSIQIDRETQNILAFKDVYVESTSDDGLLTQHRVLASRSLARSVIEDLQLDKSPEFQGGPPTLTASYMQAVRRLFGAEPAPQPAAPAPAAEEPDALRPLIDAYLGRVVVTPVSGSRLVNVTFDGKDPKIITEILNAHARHYIEQNMLFKFEATQTASSFLSSQLGSVRANLEKSEDALQQYSRDNQILFLDEGRNTATARMAQLEQEYTTAQTDLITKETYDRLIRAGSVDTLPQIANSGLVAALNAKLADLRREDSELAVTFSADYPRRQRIRSQMEETQKTITAEKARAVETVKTEYLAAQSRAQLLAKALQDQRFVVETMNQEIIHYNILKREVDANRQLHDGLLTRLREAEVSAGLRASNIRVVDRAEIPRAPVRPNRRLNLMLSLAIGLIFGVGLAFVQEYLDNTIKSPDDITKFLGQNTLVAVPKYDTLSDGKGYGYLTRRSAAADQKRPNTGIEVISNDHPGSMMAEAYRSLRTSLFLSSTDRPPRTIVVTSAAPSEGKTVTAVNTAISLTQTGARVLLVDTDMRKPRLHTVFGFNGVVGLSNFLAGASELKDVIHETRVPNLFLLPCGALPPNPGELIISNRFKKVVQVLGEYFDHIVFDSPPLSNVSDARNLASSADATIVVVKAYSTPRQIARAAIDQLVEARARISGVLLNDVDIRGNRGYYSYYTKQYYGTPVPASGGGDLKREDDET